MRICIAIAVIGLAIGWLAGFVPEPPSATQQFDLAMVKVFSNLVVLGAAGIGMTIAFVTLARNQAAGKQRCQKCGFIGNDKADRYCRQCGTERGKPSGAAA